MKWESHHLSDILKITDNRRVLADQTQYKYAALYTYPRGLCLEGVKKGTDFRGKQQQAALAGQFVIASAGVEQRLWGIVPADLPEVIVHRSYHCFDLQPHLNLTFLAAYLGTNQFAKAVTAACTRTGHLDLRPFSNILLPYPPADDQQQIAEIWTYALDALAHTGEIYDTIVELKARITDDVFQTVGSSRGTRAYNSRETIRPDEAPDYPVYVTANGELSSEKPATGKSVTGIMPDTELNNRYLYYFLENQNRLRNVREDTSGFETMFQTLHMALPTLYEQGKVVTLLQQFDDALETLEREQQELRQLTASIIELVFSDRLLPQEALSLLHHA